MSDGITDAYRESDYYSAKERYEKAKEEFILTPGMDQLSNLKQAFNELHETHHGFSECRRLLKKWGGLDSYIESLKDINSIEAT